MAVKSGALNGDLNETQRVALAISQIIDKKEKIQSIQIFQKSLENLFDMWVSVEHRQVWEDAQKKRKEKEEEKVNLNNKDMTDILESLARSADIERREGNL